MAEDFNKRIYDKFKPASPPPPPQIFSSYKTVTDSNVLSGLWINAILGTALLVGFCIAQTLNKKLYRFRAFSQSVSLRPPDIPMRGKWGAKYWMWAVITWRASDLDILMSCGLDAFVMTKIPVLGMQLFAPLAIVSMAVLIPVHLSFDWLATQAGEVNSSRLAWTTLSSIPPGDHIMWLHVSLLFLFTFYGLALLYYHFIQFARLRLRYLSRGDDLSFFVEIVNDKIKAIKKRIALHNAKAGVTQTRPSRTVVALEKRLNLLLKVMDGVHKRIYELEQLRAEARGPLLSASEQPLVSGENLMSGGGPAKPSPTDTMPRGGGGGPSRAASAGVMGDERLAGGGAAGAPPPVTSLSTVAEESQGGNGSATGSSKGQSLPNRVSGGTYRVASKAGPVAEGLEPPAPQTMRHGSDFVWAPARPAGRQVLASASQDARRAPTNASDLPANALHLHRTAKGPVAEGADAASEQPGEGPLGAPMQGAPSGTALQGAPSGASLQATPSATELQGAPSGASLPGAPSAAQLQGAPSATQLQGAPSGMSLQGATPSQSLQGGMPSATTTTTTTGRKKSHEITGTLDKGFHAHIDGYQVTGVGKMGAAKVDVLRETAPIMFLERPSVRFSSSILVPVRQEWDHHHHHHHTQSQSHTPTHHTHSPNHHSPALPPHGPHQQDAISHETITFQATEPTNPTDKLSSQPTDQPPNRQTGPTDRNHHCRANLERGLPWGDPDHSGRPHLHTVQINRYAVLVTDVPVPPFAPPYVPTPAPVPGIGGPSNSLLSRVTTKGSLVGGHRRGSTTVFYEGSALGDVSRRQSVERESARVWQWLANVFNFVFPSYGLVAEMLEELQLNLENQDERDEAAAAEVAADAAAEATRQAALPQKAEEDEGGEGGIAAFRGGGDQVADVEMAAEMARGERNGTAEAQAGMRGSEDGAERLYSEASMAPLHAHGGRTSGSGAGWGGGERVSPGQLLQLGSLGTSPALYNRRVRPVVSQPSTRWRHGSALSQRPSVTGGSATTAASGLSSFMITSPAAGPEGAQPSQAPGIRRRHQASMFTEGSQLPHAEVNLSAAAHTGDSRAHQSGSSNSDVDEDDDDDDDDDDDHDVKGGTDGGGAGSGAVAGDGGGGGGGGGGGEGALDAIGNVRPKTDKALVQVASRAVRALRARSRGWQLWSSARLAVWDGRVARLPSSPAYDIVSATFKALLPTEFDRAIPILDYRRTHMLLRFWNFHMIGLDTALAVQEREQKRPRHVPCPKGCIQTHTVDSIDHLTKLVDKCQREIVQERQAILAGKGHNTGAYIVLFKTQAAAAMCASQKTAMAENRGKFLVRPAPSPTDINWKVLCVPEKQRQLWWWLMFLPKAFIILLPITAFSSAFMQLDWILCPSSRTVDTAPAGYPSAPLGQRPRECSGRHNTLVHGSEGNVLQHQGPTRPVSPRGEWSWPWYCAQDSFFSKLFKALIVGWAPSWILALYTAVILPNALHGLAQASCSCLSLSSLDQEVCWLYWWFNVINVFLCGMLGGSFMQQINQALFKHGPAAFLELIGAALPSSSNFFINFLTHKALVGFSNQMLIPNGGVFWYTFKRYAPPWRWYKTVSVREKAFKLYTCRSPRYGPEIGNMLMVFVVGLAFTVISPIVPLVAVLFFIFAYFTWKYLLMYNNVRKYETGGTYFHVVFERLLACLMIMVIFTACALGSKQGAAQFFTIIFTLPFIIGGVGWYCRKRFGPMLKQRLPYEVAARAPQAHVDPELYIHPALHPQALGWHPDLHLVWGGIGIWGTL